jgi:N6-adenosine-specific RNA methylase IME4/ParB-like chromosome segregation protein Spo0J
MKIAGYPVHTAANLFPLMDDAAFDELVEDMSANGQREPITLYQGKILDGRNRARACERLGLVPVLRRWDGDDPTAYVLSLNLARRHLTESQRAMVAARVATYAHGGDRRSSGKSAGRSQAEAARELGSSERAVRQAGKVLREGHPDLIEAVDDGHIAVSLAEQLLDRPEHEQALVAKEAREGKPAAKVVRELNRRERHRKLSQISAGNRPLDVTRQYGVILADPPWQYRDGTTTPNRSIEAHYPPMPLDEICALPVRELALPDAVLFLWVTSPLMFEVTQPVLNAWGFDYKSSWIWHKKDRRGMGYWSIVEHELLLICARGDAPPPDTAARFPSVFASRPTDHSAKPEEAHRRIELMYPSADRIELFCRTPRKGWNVWGNQSGQ